MSLVCFVTQVLSTLTHPDQINKTSLSDSIGFMAHIILHFFSETRWSLTFHLIR